MTSSLRGGQSHDSRTRSHHPAGPAGPARAARRPRVFWFTPSITQSFGDSPGVIDHRSAARSSWLLLCSSASSSSIRTKASVLQLFGDYVGTVKTAGPALGEPVLHQEAHLAAHPQLREHAPEGQRQRGQPDRDCRGRRVAGRRHRRSGVRGRRLQQLRQGAERGGAAQPGDELHLRRARRRRRCRCAATPPRSPST